MISTYLIRHDYLLVKLIRDKKQVVSPQYAIDNKYIIPENSREDGSIGMIDRSRPFYTRPYHQMFCEDAPNCDLECPKCYQLEQEEDYWNDADIGFLCGRNNNTVVIDNDTGMGLDEFRKFIEKNYGELPDTWISESRSGGHHFYYHYEGFLPSNINEFITGCDVIAHNRFVCLPPCRGYKWLIPPSSKPANLPSWILNLRINKLEAPRRKERRSYIPNPTDDNRQVASALAHMNVENLSGDQWYKVGYSLVSNGFEREFRDWSATDSRPGKMFKEGQIKAFRSPSKITSLGVFFTIAKEHGWRLNNA